MNGHPYRRLPDRAFWRRSVSDLSPADVDPVGDLSLRIDRSTRVATAGSCFAQHIARHLQGAGFNYYVTEAGHPSIPQAIRRKHNYGQFSARYGNIYTARQLVQLMHRATGRFEPAETVWHDGPNLFIDPYRPTVQPGGYVSMAELTADRQRHLAAVRTLFKTLDVFVFTLGLTECWRSRRDGAVFPVCPGVKAGRFDPDAHEFYNQSVADVTSDLQCFVEELQRINPKAQVLLTVSPVPLAATAEAGAHVLTATTYSKSVLRVAANEICAAHANVHYFPSFEIITGTFNRGAYYGPDLRAIEEDGVEHVMRLFFQHAAGLQAGDRAAPDMKLGNSDRHGDLARRLIEVECDEAALDSR